MFVENLGHYGRSLEMALEQLTCRSNWELSESRGRHRVKPNHFSDNRRRYSRLSAVRVPADVSRNRFRAFATNCRSCRIHVSWPHRTLTHAEEWHLVWSPRDRGPSRTPTQHETRENSASRRHRRPIVRLRVRRQASHVDPSLTRSWLPFANDHLNGDPTLHAQDEDATWRDRRAAKRTGTEPAYRADLCACRDIDRAQKQSEPSIAAIPIKRIGLHSHAVHPVGVRVF
jgi:hypothetical protein